MYETRDLTGRAGEYKYANPWPNDAKIAVSFVVNYEEGGERSILYGDEGFETFLTEAGLMPFPNRPVRERSIESCFEYGSRCGFWRILHLFKKYKYPFTCWAIGQAVEKNPIVVAAMEENGCEVGSHSYRWINYENMDPKEEYDHVVKSLRAIQSASPTGKTPRSWYTGRASVETRKVVCQAYKDLGLPQPYDSDEYNDDLPYWLSNPLASKPNAEDDEGLLIVPYTLDVNDMKFAVAPGFSTAEDFFTYARDAFDVIYEEGTAGTPKMITIGLHCRMIGRPGRFRGLQKLMAHIASKEGVWVATREQIAECWKSKFPYRK
ncbi:chitin deacetylase Cda1 [Schizosaccharomyces japonicus yFS275]|uniref:Chitin deacetylase Cda1 n=1 Tax=Schizosaccharomyces japonicus (strain yFS275 / FY16936) TaxID=402676 RepID=B6K332_SCHJY|nr:chitin deacetylase Cda1 [Schizosaccharomyces japonicus yFS275]EEB07889.1 chitin deacetylase Cda1 [Schizosaccharomyces japonicus yFS275]